MVDRDPTSPLQELIPAGTGPAPVETETRVVSGDGPAVEKKALGGRIKGSRNRITIARLELEETLRKVLANKSPALLGKAIEMATGHEPCELCRAWWEKPKKERESALPICGGPKDGNPIVMKALLDKVLTTPKEAEDADGADRAITVQILNMTGSKKETVEATARVVGP